MTCLTLSSVKSNGGSGTPPAGVAAFLVNNLLPLLVIHGKIECLLFDLSGQ